MEKIILSPIEIIKAITPLYHFVASETAEDDMDCDLVRLITQAITDYHAQFEKWIPIEYAPKDGTMIIAAYFKNGFQEVRDVWWQEEFLCFIMSCRQNSSLWWEMSEDRGHTHLHSPDKFPATHFIFHPPVPTIKK